METKIKVNFVEGETDFLELEERVKFLKNLPIEINFDSKKATHPSERMLDVCFSNLSRVVNIYPVSGPVSYINLEKIKDCLIEDHPDYLRISKKTERDKGIDSYHFHRGH